MYDHRERRYYDERHIHVVYACVHFMLCHLFTYVDIELHYKDRNISVPRDRSLHTFKHTFYSLR